MTKCWLLPSDLKRSLHLQNLLAWTSMVAAIFAGSAIGPMFKYMESSHITACLSASWRCQCMTLFLIPAALLELKFQSPQAMVHWLAKKPDLSYPLIIHVCFAGFGWTCNLLLWVIALQYTSTVQASVLTSTHPLMLILYFYFTGTKTVSKYEWLGVIVVTLGIITAALHSVIHNVLFPVHYINENGSSNTTTNNNNSSKTYNDYENTSIPFATYKQLPLSSLSTQHLSFLPLQLTPQYHHQQQQQQASIQYINNEWKYEVLGCVLCLLSSAGEVIVMLNRVKIKRHVPLFQYTAATTFIVTCAATGMAVLLGNEGSIDPTTINSSSSTNNITRPYRIDIFCTANNCIFGWMSSQWLSTMLLFGFVIGFVCISGFNYAVVHIPTLVFSSITLVDPLVTGLLSWGVGLEAVPDAGTWLGGVIVMAGVLLISQGDQQQRQHQQQQQEESDKIKEFDANNRSCSGSSSRSSNINNSRINDNDDDDDDSNNRMPYEQQQGEDISQRISQDTMKDKNNNKKKNHDDGVGITIDDDDDDERKQYNNSNDNNITINVTTRTNASISNAFASIFSSFLSLSKVVTNNRSINNKNNMMNTSSSGTHKDYDVLPMIITTCREEDEEGYYSSTNSTIDNDDDNGDDDEYCNENVYNLEM